MVVSILLALALAGGQTAPTPGQLSGRVLVEGTNAPLAGARVTAIPTRPSGPPRSGPFGPPPQTTTDENGRFAFSGLAEGEYRLDVQRSGYAPLIDWFGKGETVHVPSNGHDVHLQRGGVITGRVLDGSGQPLSDLQIMALRRVDLPGAPGTRYIPAPMQGMQQTNDLGEFRIAGLAAGEYLVSAMKPMTSPFGNSGVTATAHASTMTNTYYPGTANQAAAQPVAVRAGDTVANIEFVMQSSPAFRVSGRVVDQSGQPLAGAMVMLMGDPRTAGFMGPGGHAQSDSEGRFSMVDVTPGTYRLHVSLPVRMDPPDGATGAGGIGGFSIGFSSGVAFNSWSSDSGSGGGASEMTEVTVTDANVTGIRLTIKR